MGGNAPGVLKSLRLLRQRGYLLDFVANSPVEHPPLIRCGTVDGMTAEG